MDLNQIVQQHVVDQIDQTLKIVLKIEKDNTLPTRRRRLDQTYEVAKTAEYLGRLHEHYPKANAGAAAIFITDSLEKEVNNALEKEAANATNSVQNLVKSTIGTTRQRILSRIN